MEMGDAEMAGGNQKQLELAMVKLKRMAESAEDIRVTPYIDGDQVDLPFSLAKFVVPTEDELLALARASAYLHVSTVEYSLPPIDKCGLLAEVDTMSNILNLGKTKLETVKAPPPNNDKKTVLYKSIISLKCQQLNSNIIARILSIPTRKVEYISKLCMQVGIDDAIAATGKKCGRPKLLSRDHKSFIEAMIKVTDGIVTIKEKKAALESSFSGLSKIALFTISLFLRSDMRVSKRRICTRNPRVEHQDRHLHLAQYAFKLLKARQENVHIINVDEAAIMLGQCPSMRWAPIGQPNLFTEETTKQGRFTLVLGVSSRGFRLGGSLKAAVHLLFMLILSQKSEGGSLTTA